MTWQQANYDDVKDAMRPGDVVAFGGTKFYSEVSKTMTRSPVSHVALVLRSSLPPDDVSSPQSSPQIIEAIKEGIVVRWLDEHITGYPGNIWWLPLSDAIRDRLDLAKFSAFLLEQVGVPFDTPQAAQAVLDELDHIPLIGDLTHSEEDFSALFCSEVAAAGLEAGGAIGSLNCSEVTPIDMFQFAIYQGTYYQIKGPRTLVAGFNTVNPEGWGE
jgi:hypothetical protein